MLDTIGNSLRDALSAMLLTIPRLVSFLIIVIIGWVISGIVGKAVGAVLRTIKFNDMAQRAGITGFVKKMGVDNDPAGVLGAIITWFIRLIALVVAFDALGVPAVSSIIRDFLAWLPNLVVALVIIVIAGLLANALGDLVRGATSQAGFGNPNLLASIARVAVLAFGIIAAVNQVGIASALVNTLFMGLIGALALAAGLAFGLGGRETAGQIVQGWYQQAQQAAPKIQRAANVAQQQVSQGGSSGGSQDHGHGQQIRPSQQHPGNN